MTSQKGRTEPETKGIRTRARELGQVVSKVSGYGLEDRGFISGSSDHSPPSSAEVNTWRSTSTHPYVSMAWQRDNFKGFFNHFIIDFTLNFYNLILIAHILPEKL
jgi:hypothetical protein